MLKVRMNGNTVHMFDDARKEIAKGTFDLGRYHVTDGFLGNFEALFASAVALERGVNDDIELYHPSDERLRNHLESMADDVLAPMLTLDGPNGRTEQITDPSSSTVMVTLSGGLDSSTAMLRLLELGYNVYTVQCDTRATNYGGHIWNEQRAAAEIRKVGTDIAVESHIKLSGTRAIQAKIVKKPRTNRSFWRKALRNPLMIMTALTQTESVAAITLSSIREHNPGRDSRPGFLDEIGPLLGFQGCQPNIGLYPYDEIAYLLQLGKERNRQVYEMTYSCQMGKRVGPTFFCCGSCANCLLRTQAGLFGVDPIINPESLPVPAQIRDKVKSYYKFNWAEGRRMGYLLKGMPGEFQGPYNELLRLADEAGIQLNDDLLGYVGSLGDFDTSTYNRLSRLDSDWHPTYERATRVAS